MSVNLAETYQKLAGLGFALYTPFPKGAVEVSARAFESGEGSHTGKAWALAVKPVDGVESMVASIPDGEGVGERAKQGKRILERAYGVCVPA